MSAGVGHRLGYCSYTDLHAAKASPILGRCVIERNISCRASQSVLLSRFQLQLLVLLAVILAVSNHSHDSHAGRLTFRALSTCRRSFSTTFSVALTPSMPVNPVSKAASQAIDQSTIAPTKTSDVLNVLSAGMRPMFLHSNTSPGGMSKTLAKKCKDGICQTY